MIAPVAWCAMPLRPVAVAFDVVETLMPLEPLRERFTAIGLPPHLLDLQPMSDMPADP